MALFTAPFIKSASPFDANDTKASPAPIFRRKFKIDTVEHSMLRFCALGYGYCYINGHAVTDDVLTTPVSEYNKLVWYNEYDVTHLLHPGENIIAVILGNGFFNETFDSVWGNNKAPWRDHPKFALELISEGRTLLESDEHFLCIDKSFVTFNHLRSGETFDARLYDANWKQIDFDDTAYVPAIFDDRMNSAERRLCPCEPIRECEEYNFVSCRKTAEGYLLDFGINLSGYVRIYVDEPEGTDIALHHAEEAYDDGRLKLNKLDIFYPSVDFQVDRYICGRKNYPWFPHFTYHGFRFVLVKGLTQPPEKGQFKAIFVHQDIRRISHFECSDELINKIYKAGIRSTFSNLHFALTDCPTREKLGWTNDAQASFEQIYVNFDIKRFMTKWGYDYLISMQENGELPAIVPSHGWGFGHGPVADGALFRLPYIEYLYTGDSSILIEFLPWLERHYMAFIGGTTDHDSWLGDWNGHINFTHDNRFLKLFFTHRYANVITLAYHLSGKPAPDHYQQDAAKALETLCEEYIGSDQKCTIPNKCLISMLISLKLPQTPVLVQQLKELVIADRYSINFGMLCMQYIFDALSENGEAETAWKLITSRDTLSYAAWFDQGATTLWETFEMGHTDSRNHHMLSTVLAWFFKALLGVSPEIQAPGFREIHLKPCFIDELSFCKGFIDTDYGRLSISWERNNGKIEYEVSVPEGIIAYWGSRRLPAGTSKLIV